MGSEEHIVAGAAIERTVGSALAKIGRSLANKGRVSGYAVERTDDGAIAALYAITNSALGIEVRVFPESKDLLGGLLTVATLIENDKVSMQDMQMAQGAYVGPIGAKGIDYKSHLSVLERLLERAIAKNSGKNESNERNAKMRFITASKA